MSEDGECGEQIAPLHVTPDHVLLIGSAWNDFQHQLGLVPSLHQAVSNTKQYIDELLPLSKTPEGHSLQAEIDREQKRRELLSERFRVRLNFGAALERRNQEIEQEVSHRVADLLAVKPRMGDDLATASETGDFQIVEARRQIRNAVDEVFQSVLKFYFQQIILDINKTLWEQHDDFKTLQRRISDLDGRWLSLRESLWNRWRAEIENCGLEIVLPTLGAPVDFEQHEVYDTEDAETPVGVDTTVVIARVKAPGLSWREGNVLLATAKVVVMEVASDRLPSAVGTSTLDGKADESSFGPAEKLTERDDVSEQAPLSESTPSDPDYSDKQVGEVTTGAEVAPDPTEIQPPGIGGARADGDDNPTIDRPVRSNDSDVAAKSEDSMVSRLLDPTEASSQAQASGEVSPTGLDRKDVSMPAKSLSVELRTTEFADLGLRESPRATLVAEADDELARTERSVDMSRPIFSKDGSSIPDTRDDEDLRSRISKTRDPNYTAPQLLHQPVAHEQPAEPPKSSNSTTTNGYFRPRPLDAWMTRRNATVSALPVVGVGLISVLWVVLAQILQLDERVLVVASPIILIIAVSLLASGLYCSQRASSRRLEKKLDEVVTSLQTRT